MKVHVGECVVTVSEDEEGKYVLTAFPDGTSVIARPVNEDWEQTRLHDLLHSLVAELEGRAHSPSLWNVAHPDGERYTGQIVTEDEVKVLRIQELLTRAAQV